MFYINFYKLLHEVTSRCSPSTYEYACLYPYTENYAYLYPFIDESLQGIGEFTETIYRNLCIEKKTFARFSSR